MIVFSHLHTGNRSWFVTLRGLEAPEFLSKKKPGSAPKNATLIARMSYIKHLSFVIHS